MIPEELEVLAGIDVDEYFVESIVDHERDMSQMKTLGPIGMRLRTLSPWILIAKNILKSNWLKTRARLRKGDIQE